MTAKDAEIRDGRTPPEPPAEGGAKAAAAPGHDHATIRLAEEAAAAIASRGGRPA